MSVISAVITKKCTVHASDSFITQRLQNGEYQVKEKHRSKIVRVPQWRGAMAYWGLAQAGGGWSTVAWLEAHTKGASLSSSAEQYAGDLAIALNRELSRLKLDNSITSGIGIHLTAYERINDYWIPELFLISNWHNTSYRELRPTGLQVTRETFRTISNIDPDPAHREPAYRMKVHTFLQEGAIIGFQQRRSSALQSCCQRAFRHVFRTGAPRFATESRRSTDMDSAGTTTGGGRFQSPA